MVSPTSLQTHGVEVNKNNRAIVLVIYSDNRSTFENNETLPTHTITRRKGDRSIGHYGRSSSSSARFFSSGGNQ